MEKLQLTKEERELVDATVSGLPWYAADVDLATVTADATVAAQTLPERLRSFLTRVRVDETAVAVVSGLPLGPLPPTPIGWRAAAESGAGRHAEIVLLLCGVLLGDPFGWATQQDGRLVHDVCPARGMEHSLTSASSGSSLTLHTEDVHHPCRADYVALLCLRNPDAVGTTYAPSAELNLPEQHAQTLAQPRYRFYPDDSHQPTADGATPTYATGPVMFGPPDQPYLRFDEDFMGPADNAPDATQALAEMRSNLAASAAKLVLAPGEVAFFDNYRLVHGREPFVARYDGNDRWLKRLNLIRDVRRLHIAAGTRSRILS